MADTVPGPVRFGELAKQLMRHEATRKDRGEFAELSYRADQIRLATEIIPFFGPMPVKAITAQHVESFYFNLIDLLCRRPPSHTVGLVSMSQLIDRQIRCDRLLTDPQLQYCRLACRFGKLERFL